MTRRSSSSQPLSVLTACSSSSIHTYILHLVSHITYSYLEHKGDLSSQSALVRPWVWIIWIAMGPMVDTILLQLYELISVRTLLYHLTHRSKPTYPTGRRSRPHRGAANRPPVRSLAPDPSEGRDRPQRRQGRRRGSERRHEEQPRRAHQQPRH